MNSFIAICRADDHNSPTSLAISPSPEVPPQRLGFVDVIPDQADEVVRRHLLGMDESATCPTKLSLSFQLILHYLKQENIEPKITSKNQIKIGNVILPRLQKPAGAYSYLKFDDEGYQILLNYRTDKPIAVQYPLRDILDKRVNPNLIKDRIVLIGNTDYASIKDDFATPFTQNSNQKMRGVMIHAQMVSQVLSAVLDGRPLLWVLPVWGDIVWVWVWVIIGGIIGWVGRYLERLQGIGVMAIAVVILGISCFVIFVQLGGWFPLIPAVLGLLVTGIVIRVTNNKI
jgi:CHASE2 domain-containing sensor protein